jgi:hypothetical protein
VEYKKISVKNKLVCVVLHRLDGSCCSCYCEWIGEFMSVSNALIPWSVVMPSCSTAGYELEKKNK